MINKRGQIYCIDFIKEYTPTKRKKKDKNANMVLAQTESLINPSSESAVIHKLSMTGDFPAHHQSMSQLNANSKSEVVPVGDAHSRQMSQ